MVVTSLLLFAAVVARNFVQTGQAIDRNKSALIALCALRHDLDVRIQSSRDFLRDHPEGFLGITRAVIAANLKSQVSTRRALEVIDCRNMPHLDGGPTGFGSTL